MTADPIAAMPDQTAAKLDVRFVDTYSVMRPGGTVTYDARAERFLGDGVGAWFGWVGDALDEHGDRRWWVEWREDGDAAARWDSGPVFGSFTEARDALLSRRADNWQVARAVPEDARK